MYQRVLLIFLGYLFFSELSLANLLQNPSFDFWVDDSTPNNWVVEYRTYAGVFKESGTIHSGPFSARLIRRQAGTGNNRGLRQRIPVTPDISYTLSAWFYDNHDQVSGGIVLTWRNIDSVAIGSTGVVYTQDTASWQFLTLTATAPNRPPDSVAAFVDVLLRTYGFTGSQPGGFVFVDDVDFDVSAISESKIIADPTFAEYLIITPNPFSFHQNINFKINRKVPVRLSIYDISGKLAKVLLNQTLNPGSYNIIWNGKNEKGGKVAGGIYYVILETNKRERTVKKLVYTPH